MTDINNNHVICPNCAHQFRAVPVNVQDDLAALRARLAEAETALRHYSGGTSEYFERYPDAAIATDNVGESRE